MTRIGLLGHVEVRTSGRAIPLPTLKSRAVLALLTLRANSPVSQNDFVSRLWDTRPPLTAVAVLRNNVSTLRRSLGPVAHLRIETAEGGYLLRTDPRLIDVERFTSEVERSRLVLRAGDAERAAGRLREALGMWRGPALADLASAGYDWPERRQLDQLRLTALELRIEADLQRGLHREVAAELEFLIREYPTRVEFHRQHIVAARGAGRGADAAESFVRASTVLRDHHGQRPDPALEDAHRALLGRDETGTDALPNPGPSVPAASPRITVPSPQPPRSFPPRISGDAIPAETARTTDGTCELRRVVILCLRLRGSTEVDDRYLTRWSPILRQIGQSGGHAEKPSGLIVTAYYGLYQSRADELAWAIRTTTEVRNLAEYPDVAAAIMKSTILRVDQSGSAEQVSWVVGSVVAQCRDHVRQTPPGRTVVV